MNKIKKFLTATLSVLTAGVCMLGIASCGGGEGESQKCEEHTVAEWYWDFTTGEKGCETATLRGPCTVCYQTVVKTGAEHDLDESTTTTHEVTCEEDGYDEAVCKICGHTVKTNIVEALGHDEKEVVVEPTCTTDGYTEHGCTRCGLEKDNIKPMSGHNVVDGECTYCEKEESTGLRFEEIDGKYWVNWWMDCTDEDLIIPATHEDKPVVGIKRGAFSSADGNPNYEKPFNLKHVTIPASIKVVEEEAFLGCTNLETVTFLGEGNGTVTFGRRIFQACRSLKTVNFGNRISAIPESAFLGCEGLTEITLPAGVTSIGDSAFMNCGNLASVTFNDGLQTIEYRAFYQCYDLKEVVLPDSVTDIGSGAFSTCRALTSVTMGNNVKTIGSGAFTLCSELKDISIPESVTKIGVSIFEYTGVLSSEDIDNGVGYFDGWIIYADMDIVSGDYAIKEGTVGIADSAFNAGAWGVNTSLTGITIPNTVKTIGDEAFEGCAGLTSVEIPSSVKLIGRFAFSNCQGLTSVTVGDTTIPSGVARSVVIDEYAFSYCKELTKATIRNVVKSIGQYAFNGCEKLATVEYSGTIEDWNEVETGEDWLNNTLVTEIKCSDYIADIE